MPHDRAFESPITPHHAEHATKFLTFGTTTAGTTCAWGSRASSSPRRDGPHARAARPVALPRRQEPRTRDGREAPRLRARRLLQHHAAALARGLAHDGDAAVPGGGRPARRRRARAAARRRGCAARARVELARAAAQPLPANNTQLKGRELWKTRGDRRREPAVAGGKFLAFPAPHDLDGPARPTGSTTRPTARPRAPRAPRGTARSRRGARPSSTTRRSRRATTCTSRATRTTASSRTSTASPSSPTRSWPRSTAASCATTRATATRSSAPAPNSSPRSACARARAGLTTPTARTTRSTCAAATSNSASARVCPRARARADPRLPRARRRTASSHARTRISNLEPPALGDRQAKIGAADIVKNVNRDGEPPLIPRGALVCVRGASVALLRSRARALLSSRALFGGASLGRLPRCSLARSRLLPLSKIRRDRRPGRRVPRLSVAAQAVRHVPRAAPQELRLPRRPVVGRVRARRGLGARLPRRHPQGRRARRRQPQLLRHDRVDRVLARERRFAGTYWSTFTGYIHRLRGYHRPGRGPPSRARARLLSASLSRSRAPRRVTRARARARATPHPRQTRRAPEAQAQRPGVGARVARGLERRRGGRDHLEAQGGAVGRFYTRS